jgi:hypothetical protein
MSNYDRSNRVIGQTTTAVSAVTPADIGTWTILGPVIIARVGALAATAQTGTAPVLSFDLRPTYGSDTGRLAAKIGRCQFPAGGVALGKTVTAECRSIVNAGQQVVCAVTTGATAGTVIPFIEWVTRTENTLNQASAQLASVIQPGPLTVTTMSTMSLLDGEDLASRLVQEREAEEREAKEREEKANQHGREPVHVGGRER